jgi:hypothetical protein
MYIHIRYTHSIHMYIYTSMLLNIVYTCIYIYAIKHSIHMYIHLHY